MFWAHPSAVIDEGSEIGEGTKIWHFCHILPGVEIGENCSFGQNVMVGPRVRIGRNVKVQNNVSIYEGVTLEDDVFCGPSMVFTNVINPRSHVNRKQEFRQTVVRKGATIGANATVICGVEIGSYAFIGAGAVVTKDVQAHALVVGNPARQIGWVCRCGCRLLAMDGVCSQGCKAETEEHEDPLGSPMREESLLALINNYQAEQRPDEVLWFYRHCQKIGPKVIVEIGTKEGGNLKVLSTHLKSDGLIVGIDVRRVEDVPWRMDDAECSVNYIQGNSHSPETKKKLVALLGDRTIDILFIDGDHSCSGMLQDYEDYSPFVRTGGIIAVHDIFYLEPASRAWEELPGNDWYESPRSRSSIGIGFVIKG